MSNEKEVKEEVQTEEKGKELTDEELEQVTGGNNSLVVGVVAHTSSGEFA